MVDSSEVDSAPKWCQCTCRIWVYAHYKALVQGGGCFITLAHGGVREQLWLLLLLCQQLPLLLPAEAIDDGVASADADWADPAVLWYRWKGWLQALCVVGTVAEVTQEQRALWFFLLAYLAHSILEFIRDAWVNVTIQVWKMARGAVVCMCLSNAATFAL